LLARWKQPPGRDMLHGEWMPLDARDDAPVARAVDELALRGETELPVEVERAWIRLIARHTRTHFGPGLLELARDGACAAALRAEALRALVQLRPAGLLATLHATLFDSAAEVRAATLEAFQAVAPEAALPLLENALGGALLERRVAYAGLAKLDLARADELFLGELEKLRAGYVPLEAALDLVRAAESRSAELVQEALAARVELHKQDPALARFADCLYGGDAERGREIFRGRAALECLRCHAAEESDTALIGPRLEGLGARATRLEIVESICDPNRRFALGFQGTLVFLEDGTPLEGQVIEEAAQQIKLRQVDGSVVAIERSEIEAIKAGLSAMPTNLTQYLTREDMRDLVEYLKSL
jgi:quinoprotein glucose dehydrogenase